MKYKNQEIIGICVAAIGLLFLLVNNGLLWFGWEAIWPGFLFLSGVYLLHSYTKDRKPELLFWGLALTQLAVFFFLFSVGVLPWTALGTLWPFFPLIVGIGLLALAGTGQQTSSSLVVGLVLVIAAVVSFWAAREPMGSGVLTPLVRFWPVVLVVAGILVFRRAKRERLALEQLHPEPVQRDEPPV